MTFQGFARSDFDTFLIPGLEPRMQAIRERIQPKFRAIGEPLADYVGELAEEPMFVHIAQHARRKTNAPIDTWMALSPGKRGYKMFPHLQIGLFDDHLFLWLAYIYELPQKRAYADALLANTPGLLRGLPAEYLFSGDHMKKDAAVLADMTDEELRTTLLRFREVKKAEWMVGRRVPADDQVLRDGAGFLELARTTFASLMPLYRATQRIAQSSLEQAVT